MTGTAWGEKYCKNHQSSPAGQLEGKILPALPHNLSQTFRLKSNRVDSCAPYDTALSSQNSPRAGRSQQKKCMPGGVSRSVTCDHLPCCIIFTSGSTVQSPLFCWSDVVWRPPIVSFCHMIMNRHLLACFKFLGDPPSQKWSKHQRNGSNLNKTSK